MLVPKAAVAIVALAQSVTALFLWYPDYKCAELPSCSSPKGPTERSVEEKRSGATFEIFHRVTKSDVPHDTRIQRLAERLSHKYNRGAPIRSAVPEGEEGLEKRANAHSVVPAANPTTPNSAGINQDGTDFSYFTTVKLGSKGTPVNMLLDTGAGTSWIMGPSCKSEPCLTRNSFGEGSSDTFKATGTTFELHYGSGNVSGSIAEDTLRVAGITLNATFGIADVTSPDFNNFPIDGILGLAQSKGSNPTFMQTLVQSKTLKDNLFSVSLNRASDGPNDGVINFGFIDNTRFTGKIGYTPLHGQQAGDWAITLDEVVFDGDKAGIKNTIAYIDTGTSYIFTGQDDVAKIHAMVPGASTADNVTYRVPCTTTTDLEFSFGGVLYAISSKDWVGPNVYGQCTSNIYGHDVVAGAWLLGDTFLKNVYAVFDFDNEQIGFAPKPTPSVSSTAVSTPTGGPNSLSKSPSSTLPSPKTTSISGSSNTLVSSNSSPIGSPAGVGPSSETGSTVVETTAPPPPPQGPGETTPPGLGGHQTSDSSVAEAAEGSSTPTPTLSNNTSGAARFDINFIGVFFAVLSLLTFT